MAESSNSRSARGPDKQDFADMVSLVALANTHLELSHAAVREGLDKLEAPFSTFLVAAAATPA